MKEKVVVVCPGRGSYTKDNLGYLKKYRPAIDPFVQLLDQKRQAVQMPSISDLDNETQFKVPIHTKGEHASTLIYACAAADFMSIDRNKYDIVGIAGNSMGWYITLALGGALSTSGAFEVINTMGSMMMNGVIGAQLIYPIVNADWQVDPEKVRMLDKMIAEVGSRPGCEVYNSIHLGGYRVLGGTPEAIKILLKELPKQEDYPFQLINHAAFHTPLLHQTSQKAFELLPMDLFRKPQIPLIDGRGKIWQPYSTQVEELYRYTLDTQVVEPYDFTASITVALKELMPDRLILLGPGNSLGGAIGQTLIMNNWKFLSSKAEFVSLQKTDPLLISMGLPEQAKRVQGNVPVELQLM